MGECAHGHAVDREREVHVGVRAFEGVRDDVVHVESRTMKSDRDLDGGADKICCVVPRLVVYLARVKLGGFEGADTALLGGRAKVP